VVAIGNSVDHSDEDFANILCGLASCNQIKRYRQIANPRRRKAAADFDDPALE
jgi:hypothetical protein